MERTTDMEAQAIKDARRPLYEALLRIGIVNAFDNCSAAEIDYVIETVWDSVRASMQTQSRLGAIPVPLAEAALAERVLP
jgi:hypothetical protein